MNPIWTRLKIIFRSWTSRLRDFSPAPMHPKRWWPGMLIGAAVLLVLTFAFNVGFFIIRTRAIRSASEAGFDLAQVAVNRTELADVIRILDGREAEFQKVLFAPARSDPSL